MRRREKMNRQRFALYGMIEILIILLLAGCGPPAAPPTPTPPTATQVALAPTPVRSTDTPVRPTIRPTRTPHTLVGDVELLIGNWQPLGGRDSMFLQMKLDGTCRQSFSLERLMENPQVECTYTFENSILSMTAVKLNGVPACPSATGSYEVRLISDDQIQLAVNQDSCAPRKRSTTGSYKRIP